MVKVRLKKFIQSDKFIIILGIIAGILLLSNLLFSSYTLLKQNYVVKRDVERIEKIENRILEIEIQLKEFDSKEVE